MTRDRWTLALDTGALALSEGATLVMQAKGEADYGNLGTVRCVQGFKPDADRLTARGHAVGQTVEGRFANALIHVGRSRAATLAAIAQAMSHVAPGGMVLVDGRKDEGVEAVSRQLRRVAEVDGVLAKAHGKLIWLRRPATLPEEMRAWGAAPAKTASGHVTAAGGFSADGPDRGSELLVALLPPLSGRVADFGAGWGYIAAEVLAEQDGIAALDLIEAQFQVLEAAKANIDDPRAHFHWADATRFEPAAPYDAILSNPPFHSGRRADPGLGRAFIAAAARTLKPAGRFYMVANRHLPYEGTLKAAFGTGRLLGELEGYKIYEAARPRTARSRRQRR